MNRTANRIACLLLLFVTFSAFAADGPFTTRNDDSCDVMLAPAATLLLPYFEVDVTSRTGETTLFTVTNVTELPRIARVTLWTDWSFPVLTFNIFLTGYDTQSINLYDVLVHGQIAESGTGTGDSVPGHRSQPNTANPLLDLTDCAHLAGIVPATLVASVRSTLTNGQSTQCAAPARVGGVHAHAVGYATIDVVANCGPALPTDADYATKSLLYDNVLSGDYQQVNSSQNFAQGAPMVHIRAFPEGGVPGGKPTNLRRTFYGNLHNSATADRRQPLPSTFAARWITGGAESQFHTSYKIWREGLSQAGLNCTFAENNRLQMAELVRFDEDENPTTAISCQLCDPPVGPLTLPPTSRTGTADAIFPPNTDDAVAGWMYMNLDNGLVENPVNVASQNWVVVSMAAEGRYSVDFDAASLGNGCSALAAVTNDDGGAPAIAPAPAANGRFANGSPATTNNDDSCDVIVTPAATLLLPYFEIDPASTTGETTIFSVTNVTPLPQIAHVTLWTDASFPVISFDLFLTGYDVQSINLRDVIVYGHIAPPGTTSGAAPGRRSAANTGNPLLDITSCSAPLTTLPALVVAEMLNAFTVGRNTACGTARIGAVHAHAIGYATVDVVQRCGSGFPTDTDYFTRTLLYDNVLIGDYEQVNSTQNSAQGNPMVHIRAIPEGGAPGTGTTNFTRTFYSRLQNGGTADRRQPLPSTFAARWIGGGPSGFSTGFKIWREGLTKAAAGCAVSANLNVPAVDLVRFDEQENPSEVDRQCPILCPTFVLSLPTSLRADASSDIFPPALDARVAGWMYFNLDNETHQTPVDVASQNWVIVSMAAEGRYSVDFDALSLANGCTAATPITDSEGGPPRIGPGTNP
jgi:hypothetical protein